MPEKIFFQSSMPRALSTTLQNIIGQNPDFYVTPTSGALELVYAARANYTNSPEFKAQDAELMKKAFMGFCKSGIDGYFNAITDKKYVLDKSRGWGINRPFLEAYYPNPKIICMVRNLKDIVASYERMHRNNPHKSSPMINEQTGQGTTTAKRVDIYMDETQTIGKAIMRIFEIIEQRYDDKILFVKAEDLCLYPENEMIRIYDYLGIPHFTHDFDNIEQITFEDDEVFGMGKGLHTVRPKLEMKPSDADAILGKHITEWLYNKYKWYYDKFKYRK